MNASLDTTLSVSGRLEQGHTSSRVILLQRGVAPIEDLSL